MGKTPLEAARDSAREISVPVLMATITTVVVFLPLVFMTGMGKYLFTPLATSAALAMFASYIVSRTVSPLYCSRHLRPHTEKERFPRWLLVVGALLALLGLAVWLTFRLGAVPLDRFSPDVRHIVLLVYQGTLIAGVCGAGVFGLALLFWLAPLFDRVFQMLVAVYEGVLRFCLRWRLVVVVLLAALVVPAGWAARQVGQELFPEVDTSDFTVHMRATGGPRVEETERQVEEIERIIRDVVAPEDLELILANIGISSRWSAIFTENNGPHAAFVRVQLRSGFAGRHTPTLEYVDRLRVRLQDRFPSNDFFFETGNMIRRILNSGAVAPIEVQVYGQDNENRRRVTRELDTLVSKLPQVQETYMPQGMDLPQLRVVVDRTAAARPKLTESDVVRNVITTLMSSAQIAPNLWIDPQSGNPYFIGVQYPEYAVENIQTLEKIPITGAAKDGPVVRLEDVARVERSQAPIEVYHHDVNRVSQLFVSVADNDLAGVAAEVRKIASGLPLTYALDQLPRDKRWLREDREFCRKLEQFVKPPTRNLRIEAQRALRVQIQMQYGVDPEELRLPRDIYLKVRGEISNMRQSFREMVITLVLAVLLVYLVMAAQFSSWIDPLIMIVSAPLGLIGVIFMLWASGTSLNIQSCMGVLMMVGISVSNSVLLIEFANHLRRGDAEGSEGRGLDTREAVTQAARIRMRPILMTTFATIVGLLPMALHLRPGDEMNLPLARAVIGGLAGSTLLTLFVVPVLYTLLKPRGPAV
jgi:multidrug efflux pump subunit AcrB